MKETKLIGWQLQATLPYQTDFSKHMQLGSKLNALTPWFKATVPGSVYEDLQNAGQIDDPYFGLNSLNCEWVENRWWIYKTTFTLSKDDLKETLKLTFKGIDYSAQIYLNGTRLGRHEGMYIPFDAIINDYVSADKENVLVCVIEHAPFADPQPGYTSKTRYLKARYNYKWDFTTRLVNLGIYDEVTITHHSIAAIEHSFARPIKTADGWELYTELDIYGYKSGTADISLCLNNTNNKSSVFAINEKYDITEGYNKFKKTVKLSDFNFTPELWWPNGYGEQPLYGFTAQIGDGKNISDEVCHKVGFRTIEYRHAEGREDALPYNIVINGKKIYLKGTNIVPLCNLIGSIKPDVLRMKLKAAKDCNINYFRIWGGGHIESEEFYSACDEYGIMIMQEFTMSSSGCDDVPSKNKEFLDLLHTAAVYNVKLKRNHVSLAMFSGGNELTDERYLGRDDHEGHPATFEDSTLAMLKGLIDTLSPDIMMLPSSASGPNALLKVGDIGNNHDVHGPWGYVGVYEHYNFYNNSDSIVHGEFGCGGISNYDALKRFLPESELHLATSYTSRCWAHHSGGWDNYSLRERMMFGDLFDIPFEDYIKVNQFVQAESLRYSLEANRRRQWKNVGQMTWQFNEPWPNIQCSNVLDYYGGKKLAYYFMRDAYKSVLTSLKYYKLFFKGGEDFNSEIFIINDKKDAPYKIDCEITDLSGKVLFSKCFEGIAKEDISASVGEVSIKLPDNITGGFKVKLHTLCGDFNDNKQYLMLIADKEIPVEPYEHDIITIETFSKKRSFANKDDLRADYRPILAYYDEYIKTQA